MYIKSIVITMALLFSIALSSFAQTGHKIDFNIEGLQDSTILLGYFFGESTYVKDTAQADSNGAFSFQGDIPLDKGMYFLVLGKSRLFDFPIGTDQHFEITTKSPDYIPNLKVVGDNDNEIFLQDMLYNGERNREAAPFVKVIRDENSTEEAKLEARESLSLISDKVEKHQEEVIKNNPSTILSTILKSKKQINVPEPPLLENGQQDSTFGYRYYKAHYWDNFDLANPVLLRLSEPLYRKKVEEYLDKLIFQHPDSIFSAIQEMADKAIATQDTYKYFIWNVTIKYQNHEIMGLDEVFVKLYDTYFDTGNMDFWANDQLKKNLKEKADQLRNSLIGNVAPNLIMQNAELKKTALHDIKNKYTVIYFYDPDCGHCKKETPKLKEFYDATAFDVEVFAVSADTSMLKMKNYIKENNMNWINVNGPRTYTKSYQKLYDAATTPTIYVIDEKKKIIAKKLPAERLEEFLGRYERILAREN